jgi:hypothetical protein
VLFIDVWSRILPSSTIVFICIRQQSIIVAALSIRYYGTEVER